MVTTPANSVSRAVARRVVQNYIEQRTVNFQLAVILDETELPESIHEEADA